MAGLWGKLGGHGDFLALGLEEGARACVVPWLDGVLAALRDEWGAAWGARFDGMGMLGFWIGPAVSGGAPVAGVMAPSRDRVGRRYPLLVLGRGAPVPPLLAPGGFHAEAAAALAAMLAAGRAEADAWPQDLAEAPPAAVPQGDASLVWARNSGCAGGDLLAEIAHYDHAAACARRSQFWTLGPPGAVLSGDGLPDARGLGWLIEASQAETAPTGPRPADGHGEFLAEAAAPPPAMPTPESASASARIEAVAAIPETDPTPNAPRAWPGSAAPAFPGLASDAAVLESGQPMAPLVEDLAKEPPSAAWIGSDASASSAFALDAAIPEDAQPVASPAEDRAKEPPSSAWLGSDALASSAFAPDMAMPESGQPVALPVEDVAKEQPSSAWPGSDVPAFSSLAPDMAPPEGAQPAASPAGNLAKEPPPPAWSGADASASSAFALDAAIPEGAQPVAPPVEDLAKEPPSAAWSGSDTPASGSLAPDAAMPEGGQPVAPPVEDVAKEQPSSAWSGSDVPAFSSLAPDMAPPEGAQPAASPAGDLAKELPSAVWPGSDTPASGSLVLDAAMPESGQPVAAPAGMPPSDAVAALLGMPDAPVGGGADIDDGEAGAKAAALPGSAREDARRARLMRLAAAGRNAAAMEGAAMAGRDSARPGPASSAAHGQDAGAFVMPDIAEGQGAAGVGAPGMAHGKMDDMAGSPAVDIAGGNAVPSATDPPMLRLEPRFRLGAEEQADSRLVLRAEWALPEAAGQPGAPVDAAIWHLPDSPPPGPDPLEPDADKPREGG